jgi:hypothetical protein
MTNDYKQVPAASIFAVAAASLLGSGLSIGIGVMSYEQYPALSGFASGAGLAIGSFAALAANAGWRKVRFDRQPS